MTARGSAALPAALVALAVAAALTAALVEVAGTEVTIARHRRAAASALVVADTCIAGLLAHTPAGWDFGPLLAGPDGTPGTGDDGTLDAPAACTATASPAPGSPDPPRALVTVEGRAAGGRRSLTAVVGREAIPGPPALLWLAAPPAAGTVRGGLTLDGNDALDPLTPAWAALAAPADPGTLDAWIAGETPGVSLVAGTGAPIHAPAPPLSELLARLRGVAAAGAESLGSSPAPPPVLALVDGDLAVADGRHGAGLLVVSGRLDIRGALDFTGIVVATGGIDVAGGATLGVTGALWLGAPLTVGGLASVRRDAAAVGAGDRLLPLPRRAALLGLRDLG